MEPIINQNSILVCALQIDGRGDIYGAHEIALRVQQLLPHYKVVFTALKPRFGLEETIRFYGKTFVDISEIQKQESWEIEPEEKALKTIDTFQRIIVFPTYHDTLLPFEILKRNKDVIKLREYGVGSPTEGTVDGPTYTLGLGKGEKGVLLPKKLPDYKEETPLERLRHLENVHPALRKAILGEQTIQQFNQSSKLYLGYFSQNDAFFCYINALLMCKEGNPVICTTLRRPEGLIDNIKSTLWKNGFGTIKTIEFTDAENCNERTLKFKGDKNKKICTVLFRPLSASEMEAMLDATEDESLTTGDNSPLRFMAHRKIFGYDTRNQKERYAQSMIDLAAKFDHRFKTLLPFAFFGAAQPGEDINVLALEKGMVDLFNAMKESTLKENWHRFIEEVYTHYDFAPELEKILK